MHICVCACVCLHTCRVQAHTETLCLISSNQGLSLDLELGWQPVYPGHPSSRLHSCAALGSQTHIIMPNFSRGDLNSDPSACTASAYPAPSLQPHHRTLQAGYLFERADKRGSPKAPPSQCARPQTPSWHRSSVDWGDSVQVNPFLGTWLPLWRKEGK